MSIEVRIPTILRTYTGGEKAVNGDGASLSALIDDLEANHPGIKDRLVEDKNGKDDKPWTVKDDNWPGNGSDIKGYCGKCTLDGKDRRWQEENN